MDELSEPEGELERDMFFVLVAAVASGVATAMSSIDDNGANGLGGFAIIEGFNIFAASRYRTVKTVKVFPKNR